MNAPNASNDAAAASTSRDWTPQSHIAASWVDERGAVVRLMSSSAARKREASAVRASIEAAAAGIARNRITGSATTSAAPSADCTTTHP